MISSEAARRQERGFVRFRPAVGEETLGELAARRDPGDALGKLLRKYSPCLILIDEWVAYARQLHEQKDLKKWRV